MEPISVISIIVVISVIIVYLCKYLISYLENKKITQLKNSVKTLKQELKAIKQDAMRTSISEWLKNISQTSYRNEIEVEVKFINPLLWFLGYECNDFQLRVPVTIYAGRQQITGVADWVIWDNTNRKAAIIIEAKEPKQPLDETVQAQARSYAFALKASTYLLTNGRELKIYQLGVECDSCIFDFKVGELNWRWEELHKILGAEVCITVNNSDETTAGMFIEKLTDKSVPEKSYETRKEETIKFKRTESGGKINLDKPSMNDRTVGLVRDNPHKFSDEDICKIICEEWPEKSPDTVRRTTLRRLNGELGKNYNDVIIKKDEKGKYYIEE